MCCRSISWFICTFVAAAIATGCSGQDYNTGSAFVVPFHHLRIRNPRSPARGDHQTPATATPTVPAQTITLTVDDCISLLRSFSAEEKNSRLIEAAKQGAVGELEALLAAGADVGTSDEYRFTGLHWAAAGGHVEAARRLLAAGAAVDARDSVWQQTALHLAADSGHAAVVRLLLAAGADHTARDQIAWTPLHCAAAKGRTEAAAALLEGGADRGARDSGWRTPLDLARWNNRQQVVELLQASSPAGGDHQTPATATPTVPAQTITLTVDDCISLLRSLSAEDKASRLIEAAQGGAVGQLKVLLAAGADVGARDAWGRTALHWAAGKGSLEAATLLLAAGAAVDARGGVSTMQMTPLHMAAFWGHAAVVRLLLAAGADHGARSEDDGWTPLHLAAFRGRTEAAAALLEGGADRGARDSGGRTPLDLARRTHHQQLVDLLQGT